MGSVDRRWAIYWCACLRRRGLPDLVFFMLATGVRIGEALAVIWSDVDFNAGTVRIPSTLVRVKGEGLLRKGTKSRAGERTCLRALWRCCGDGS